MVISKRFPLEKVSTKNADNEDITIHKTMYKSNSLLTLGEHELKANFLLNVKLKKPDITRDK